MHHPLLIGPVGLPPETVPQPARHQDEQDECSPGGGQCGCRTVRGGTHLQTGRLPEPLAVVGAQRDIDGELAGTADRGGYLQLTAAVRGELLYPDVRRPQSRRGVHREADVHRHRQIVVHDQQ